MRLQLATLGVAVWAVSLAVPAGAVVVGQIDTFEDGTVQGWSVGAPSPLPPENVADGGPVGVGDNFMKLSAAGGRGPGSKLVAFNSAQWAGDYVGAGVTSIAMDLANSGNTDLTVRLAFADANGGPPSNIAVSNGISVLASGNWTHVVFNIDPAQLTPELGDATTALRNATELRLFHNPTAVYPGPSVVGQLGVDNIQALGGSTAIPEPSSLALLAAGLTGLMARRRLHRI